MKIRFFLSSSTQQLPIAKALAENLKEEGFEERPWSIDVHKPSQYNLESLIREAKLSDFAIFIFAPDDQVTILNKVFSVVRDNVLFELGIFMGVLGRNRCLIVQNITESMRLPSDLHGVTTLKLDPMGSEGNLREATRPIAIEIRDYALTTAKENISEFTTNDLKLLRSCKDLSMPSNQAFKAFGAGPSVWDDKLCMRFLHLMESELIHRVGSSEIETTRKGELVINATELIK